MEGQVRIWEHHSGDIRSFDFAPAPPGHGGVLISHRTRLGVDDRQPRAPLEVAHQGGPELGIFGDAQFISGLEQQAYPAAPLILSEVSIEMLPNHVRVPAVVLRVVWWATENFGQERGNVRWMVTAHVREDRPQQCIVPDVLVEAAGQSVQGFDAADPLVEARNSVA
jgi:hypothetical protein